jgi:predicted  nucleic acid-binding Zn-ribbon protein
MAARISDPSLRAAYDVLRDGLTKGEVPDVAVAHLENLLEMGLQTGRFRRQHGPEGVILLNRLYHQTPRGKEMATAASGVNKALGELTDHVIESVSIRSTAPGSYELTLLTDRCEMVVGINPGGVRVVSVLAGG